MHATRYRVPLTTHQEGYHNVEQQQERERVGELDRHPERVEQDPPERFVEADERHQEGDAQVAPSIPNLRSSGGGTTEKKQEQIKYEKQQTNKEHNKKHNKQKRTKNKTNEDRHKHTRVCTILTRSAKTRKMNKKGC